MPSFRALFAALLVSALVSLVSGQCSTAAIERCTEIEMTTPSGVFVNLVLTYDVGGEICSVQDGSAITARSAPAGSPASYNLVLAARTQAGQNMITPISTINPALGLQTINIQFTGTVGASTVPGSLTSSNLGVQSTVTFVAPGFTTSSGEQTGAALSNTCTAINGDPLFSGFKGQQFYVEGQDGQVMNMISTFNMQLNGRFVTLQEGDAITPHQQEKLQMESAVRSLSEPSVAVFPKTVAWTHPGNYIGEAGVAMVDDNRVHAKSGPFATGFSKVTLNGRPMPVSDDFVVFGTGVNTTYVQRRSAHEVMVRSVNLEFVLTNSDNFLNVEHVHMERGAKQYSHFDGLLGKTADAKWSFSSQEEKAAVVQSNNLFERTTVEA